MQSICTKINILNNLFVKLKPLNSLSIFSKNYTDDSKEKERKPVGNVEFQLTENLPDIPENYGFRGDKNVETLFALKRIRASFKYGYIIAFIFKCTISSR